MATSKRRQFEFTRLIKCWLKENWPNHSLIILKRDVYDMVFLGGHDVIYAYPNHIEVPLVIRDRKLVPGDPKFFNKLKPLITRRLNHRSVCSDLRYGGKYCFHF